jgi:hypothetical protein
LARPFTAKVLVKCSVAIIRISRCVECGGPLESL